MKTKPEKIFCVTWFRYPHGIEGESMESNSREFSPLNLHGNFLKREQTLSRTLIGQAVTLKIRTEKCCMI